MISIPQAIVLGVVQGLTEFLPVSSSAHLILWPHFFGWTDPGLAFDVALHLGTLAGVILYFASDLWKLALGLVFYEDPARQSERRLIGMLAIGTVPAALFGVLFEHRIETTFRSPVLIAAALAGMGVVLYVADRWFSGRKTISDLTFPQAVGIGLAQSIALIPGVSRSGVTISTALILGFNRREAARLSFLLSLPVIAGAGLLKCKEIFLAPDKLPLYAGFAASAVAGLLAIWVLMKFVQSYRYTPFVAYRWALAAFVLLNLSRFHP